MMAKIYPTFDDVQEYMDQYMGWCLSCGEVQAGVEPDAENYECEVCGAQDVFGIEQLILTGQVDHT